MKFEVIKASFHELKSDWEFLLSNSRSKNMFVDSAWLGNIELHEDVNTFFAYIVYYSDEPVVGIPISIPRYKGDYYDILVNKYCPIENLAEIVGGILSLSGVSIFPIGTNLRYDSYFVSRYKSLCKISEPKKSWHLFFPNSFEEYLSRFNSKKRYNILRERRILNEIDGVEIKIKNDVNDTKDLFFLHEIKWGPRWTRGTMRNFLSKVMIDFGSRTWISTIKIKEVPVYAMLSFEQNGILYFMLSGFNEKYRKLRPGIVLNTMVIEEAIKSGIKEYDMMKGNSLYKSYLGAIPKDRYYWEVNSYGSN